MSRAIAALALFLGHSAGANSPKPIALAQLPLSFERNEGQFEDSVDYASRTSGLSLYIAKNNLLLSLSEPHELGRASSRVSHQALIQLVGANEKAKPEATDKLPGVTNYLIGSDRSQWRRGIAQYKQVGYSGIYSGIDISYYGNGQSLEYDFVVRPGASSKSIQFSYRGLSNVTQSPDGDLELWIGSIRVLQKRPIVYQAIEGRRVEVSAKYVLDRRTNRAHFAIGRYDHRHDLIIDPILQYGAFIGGTGNEGANYLAVDLSGNTYITGSTTSGFLPGLQTNGFQRSLMGPSDAFVTKINAAGSAIVYTTYLGGTGNEEGTALAADFAGNVYLCGWTDSSNFPVRLNSSLPGSGAYSGGKSDGFVSVLNAAGSDLSVSFYLGGAGDDIANALTIDSGANIYVAGYTSSLSLPAMNGPQRANAGGQDAFLYKFSSKGIFAYSTFFGGAGDEVANGVAVEASGAVYVVGDTTSNTLPGISAVSVQSTRKGSQDIFLFVVTPVQLSLTSSSTLQASGSPITFSYSTFLGGSATQSAYSVVVSSGTAYFTGWTNSFDFPTTKSAFQVSNGGGYDAIVAAVTPQSLNGYATPSLTYSTYLGGSGTDLGWSIGFGQQGDIYVAGYTDSQNFLPALPAHPLSGANTFIAKLATNLSGQSLPFLPLFAGYLAASSPYAPVTLALSFHGRGSDTGPFTDDVYLAGYATSSTNLGSPVLGSFGGGTTDAFVGKLSSADLQLQIQSPTPTPTGSGQLIPGTDAFFKVAAFNAGPSVADAVTVTLQLQAGLSFVRCDGTVTCTVNGSTVTATLGSQAAGQSLSFSLVTKTAKTTTMATVLGLLSSATPDPNTTNNALIGSATLSGAPQFTTVPPDGLDFGRVALGSSTSLPISIVALVNTTLQLKVKPAQGTNTTAFSVRNTDQTINVGANSTIPAMLIFAPQTSGSASSTLDIGNDNMVLTVNLAGEGTTPVTLSATPNPVSFTYRIGDPAPSTQNLTISSNAANNVPFTIDPPADNWLSIGSQSGTTGTASAGVAVSVRVSGLQANSSPYSSTLVVRSGPTTLNVPVRLTVSPSTSNTFNVGGPLTFDYRIGDPSPASQSLNVGASPSNVSFTIDPTPSWLRVTPLSGSTPANLLVSVVTSGLQASGSPYQTNLTIRSPNASAPASVPVTLTVHGVGPPLPTINRGGVVTVSGNVQRLTPLGLVSIYGANFTDNVSTGWNGSTLPTMLGGASVTIDGQSAYLLYVSPAFMNVVVPDTATRGPVQVVVKNNNGSSAPVLVSMESYSPEFKTWANNYVEALHSDGTASSPPSDVAPSGMYPRSAPAKPGESISLWALGFGPSNPPQPAGQIARNTPLAPASPALVLTIGGRVVTPSYVGLGGVGLYQFNITVPSDLADGDYEVVATMANYQTQAGLKIPVKR